jgi:membrane dipeptidase
MIADTGGSVGIWHSFRVDGLKEMAEIAGVDHVSIGTDQLDARDCVEDYTRWVHLVAAMLRGGFTPRGDRQDRRRHYMRIFRAAVG